MIVRKTKTQEMPKALYVPVLVLASPTSRDMKVGKIIKKPFTIY